MDNYNLNWDTFSEHLNKSYETESILQFMYLGEGRLNQKCPRYDKIIMDLTSINFRVSYDALELCKGKHIEHIINT